MWQGKIPLISLIFGFGILKEDMMGNGVQTINQAKDENLFEFIINSDLSVSIDMNGWFVLIVFIFFVCMLVWRFFGFLRLNSFEVDEAELGIGNQKIKLKPNNLDAQIAYQIWVELSTRKIGIPIDREKDVIAEVYNSWYKFFEVTRELIKNIPATKIKRKETRGIIKLSIDVLNHGIRPHLTSWQAKYRRWYENELIKVENIGETPQEIQKKYPEYAAIISDLLEINLKLIDYRKTMYRLAVGIKSTKQGEG